MKRLVILLLLMAATFTVRAYDFKVVHNGNNLYFTVIDQDAKLVKVVAPMHEGTFRWLGHNAPTGVLELPSEVEYEGVKYTVVSIGERAFSSVAEITGLVLPSTLKEIGSYAFSYCTALKGDVVIGEEMITLGRSAFYGCDGITSVTYNAVSCETMGGSRSSTVFGNCHSLTTVTFGPKVRRIPDYAFAGMDALKFEWNLPQGLEYIGEYAFAYCNAIYGELRLPMEVKTVGQYAFAQCHAMTRLEIPARIVSIDQRAFYQCVNLSNITVYAIEPPSVGSDAFSGIDVNAVTYVPCISTDQYKRSSGWKKLRIIKAMQPCMIDVSATSDNEVAGVVVGGGKYRIGDSATLYALCYAGYSFLGWSDGNTDNPRRIQVVDTTSYVALIHPAEVVHEVEIVHDTIYKDGVKTEYVYYEVNDVAKPLVSQDEVRYDATRRRIELSMSRRAIIDVALYNVAGVCLYTGKPRHDYLDMRRYPTGYYVVRVSTIDNEIILRFFHN